MRKNQPLAINIAEQDIKDFFYGIAPDRFNENQIKKSAAIHYKNYIEIQKAYKLKIKYRRKER